MAQAPQQGEEQRRARPSLQRAPRWRPRRWWLWRLLARAASRRRKARQDARAAREPPCRDRKTPVAREAAAQGRLAGARRVLRAAPLSAAAQPSLLPEPSIRRGDAGGIAGTQVELWVGGAIGKSQRSPRIGMQADSQEGGVLGRRLGGGGFRGEICAGTSAAETCAAAGGAMVATGAELTALASNFGASATSMASATCPEAPSCCEAASKDR